MPNRAAVRFDEFASLQRALKQTGDDAERELRDELKNSSVMFQIVSDARALLTGSYRGRRSTGRAAASLRVGATTKGVYITGGKSTVPYYGWLDFGGDLKPSGGRRNLQKRPFKKRGRAMYPAIYKHRGDINMAAEDAIESSLRKAGLL